MNTQAIGTAETINNLAKWCHNTNLKWWVDIHKPCHLQEHRTHGADCMICAGTGYALKECNISEKLMLCVSELAEAMEGHRKNLQDDKLPHLKMLDVELADCLIRIFDLCGAMKIDIGRAFVEKIAYNLTRDDHKIESRLKEGGKQF